MRVTGRYPEKGVSVEYIRNENEKTPTRDAASRVQMPHTVQMLDRHSLTLTGVKEVTDYDAETVTLETSCGTLVVGGRALRVRDFSTADGRAQLEGQIEYLQYQTGPVQGGLLHRLFGGRQE